MSDFPFIVIVLGFAIGVIMMAGFLIMQKVTPIFEGKIPAEKQAQLEELSGSAGFFDMLFALVFFGAIATSIILSFFIKTHPAILFIAIFFIIGIAFISSAITDAYEMVLGIESFATVKDSFPLTNMIMGNLTLIIIGSILLESIVLYSALRSDE